MRLLDISMDLGPAASLTQLEAVIKGLRVATDVAYTAEFERVRRAATEQMKFPTEDELRSAWETLPKAKEEASPRYRARLHLEARQSISRVLRSMPPNVFFEYFYQRTSRLDSPSFPLWSEAGYNRVTDTPLAVGSAVGLDVIDPELYDALVANEIARLTPQRVAVRTLRYQNPLLASLFGKGSAEKTVSATAKVIEVVRDFGPKRDEAKADAEVAKATINQRIAERDLDVALKQEKLMEARLKNERLALENARVRQALGAEEWRRALLDRAHQQGQVGIADAIKALTPEDAQALGELGNLSLEVVEHEEQESQGY